MPPFDATPVPIGIAIRADGVTTPVRDFADLGMMTGGSLFVRAIFVPTFNALMLYGAGVSYDDDPWNSKACRIVEDGDGQLPAAGLRRDCILLFVGASSRQVYRELIAAYS